MPHKKDAISFHRRIVKKAVHNAWRHKHLWIFGFFASFSGFGGAFEAVTRAYDRTMGTVPEAGSSLGLGFLPGTTVMKMFFGYAPQGGLGLLVYLLFTLALLAAFAWIVVVSLGATVSGVRGVAHKHDLEFNEALKESQKRFWPLLGVLALVQLTSLAVSVVIGVNLTNFTLGGGVLNGLFFFLSFVLNVALAVVVAMIGVYSITALIDRNLGVRDSLIVGWQTFSRHWLISLEAGFLVMLIQFAVLLVGLMALVVMAIPFVFLLMLTITFNLPGMAMLVGILIAIAVVLLMSLMAAFLTVFQVSVWWQLWHEFGENRLKAALERWADKLLK